MLLVVIRHDRMPSIYVSINA